MNTPIKSLLFLVGDEEFADSPARVNRALFADPEARWEKFLDIDGYRVDVNPEPQHAAAGTRLLLACRITRPDGSWFIQPFYRSSGRATPEQSAYGVWWPTSGLYTEAYCAWAGHKSAVGYIGKHQWRATSPTTGFWMAHKKDIQLVHPNYRQIAEALAAQVPKPARR